MIYNHSSLNMYEVEDNSVHLVMTSPPYPMIKKWDACFEEQGATNFEEQIMLVCEVLNNCYTKLIDGGIMVVNMGDATRSVDKVFQCYPNNAFITTYLYGLGMYPLIPIYWKKISNRPNAFLGSGFLPVNAYISQDVEYISVFRKGKNRTFSGEEKERRKQSSFTKQERDRWFQQIWNVRGKKGAGKTSAWPDKIPYRLTRMYSIIGDTVLDPFCGSGDEEIVTALDRNYIGYNI